MLTLFRAMRPLNKIALDRPAVVGMMLGAILLPPNSVSATDQQLVERFYSAVEGRPDSLDDICVRIGVVATHQSSAETVAADNSPTSLQKMQFRNQDPHLITLRSEFATKQGSYFLETGTERSTGNEFVMALNPDYAFQISRQNDTSFYALRLLEKADSLDTNEQRAVDRRVKRLHGLLYAGRCIFGTPLHEIVASKSFRIHRIEEFTSENESEPLVRVHFDRIVKEIHPGRSKSLSDGVMILAPSAQWTLIEYSANILNSDGTPFVKMEVTQEMGNSLNGLAMATKISQTTTWLNDKRRVDYATTEIEKLSTEADDDSFYISAYGLPEPYFETQWAGAWLVYGLAGTVCFGLAYCVQRRQVA